MKTRNEPTGFVWDEDEQPQSVYPTMPDPETGKQNGGAYTAAVRKTGKQYSIIADSFTNEPTRAFIRRRGGRI